MRDKWYSLLKFFADAVYFFVAALSDVIDSVTGFNIRTFNINFLIFSETPIFTISLFNLIYLIVFFFVFWWFFNTVMSLILGPINYVKRMLSPKGVVKK